MKNSTIPINHHYVSRCHLKEFFNIEVGKIFLYDKQEDNFYNRSGVRNIFSLDNLNNRITSNNIDKISMELELRTMFEENFSKHISWLKKFCIDPENIEQAYYHMNFIATMALVGEYRNPHYKKGIDEAMNHLKTRLQGLGLILQEEMNHPDLVFKNPKSYLETASLHLMEMDPITFSIVLIDSEDHFIVPDTTSFIIRKNIDSGNVIKFGIPISNKIFILGKSSKLGKGSTQIIRIKNNQNNLVFKINSDLVNFAYKTVACREDEFLRYTIDRMKFQNFKGQYFSEYTL